MTARDTFDLTLKRVIRAPRQKVFDAFTKPDLVRQWMGPRGFKVTALEMEPRAGGRYRLTMQHRHGDTASVNGTYKEITPPERIVFTWKWDGEQMAALPETLVTVTFTERRGAEGAETEVQLLHSGFPATNVRDEHNGGWQGCLNKLADFTDVRGTAATLSLIGDARSSYVRTVRMALAEKGLKYAYDPAAPHTPPVDAINPFGRVPVFRDGDTELFETSAIVRYLDETFDGAPLVAPNTRLRAQMEQWVSVINCHGYDAMVRRYVLQYIFPKGEGGAPDRKTIDAALPEIEHLLATLDKTYGKRNFLVGDAVTMADLFLTPIVFYLGMFPESKALLDKVPNVSRAHAAIAERESFKGTMPKLG
jgi:glutathione S-transferase